MNIDFMGFKTKPKNPEAGAVKPSLQQGLFIHLFWMLKNWTHPIYAWP